MAGRSRRRRWWRKRSPFARIRKSLTPLHQHERALILADLATLGGQGSWHDFERLVPGRYDPRYFDTAMSRMAPHYVKYRGRTKFFAGAKVWSLPDIEVHEGDRCQPNPATPVQRKDA